MPQIPMERFRLEVLPLYAPPLRSRNTWFKIRQVLDVLDALGARKTGDLTPGMVARFLGALEGRSEATILGLLGYLRIVCKYAHTMGYTRVDPWQVRTDWYRAPGVGDDDDVEAKVRHVPLGDLVKLLDHLEMGASSWSGGRLYALVALVAYTGLRRSEAITRQVADFDLDRGVVRLQARRKRLKTKASAQPVGLPPEVIPILREWLPRSGSNWAFPGKTKVGPWLGGQLGCRALDGVHQAGEVVGIGRVNFLQLRHSWATHAEVRGLGELAVQRQLRHTSKRTQAHYRHADVANLASAVSGFSLRPSKLAG